MAEVTLTVQIEEELRRKAEAATAQRGESLDEIVRSAIEDYVNDSKRPDYDAETALKVDPLLSRRFSMESLRY